MKILNLYAGIGGNRKFWGDEVDVTAVENNKDVSMVYKDLYPKDIMIIGDAHEYLLTHYKEFDFIWSSPPCQTHSSFRHNICVRFRNTPPKYPSMALYEEILFLAYNAECKWVVENVNPYYPPLIEPTIILQRHFFWSNFTIKEKKFPKDHIRKAQIPDLQAKYDIDLAKYSISNKRQILRNCVLPELAEHILECAKLKTEKEYQSHQERQVNYGVN